ncbi:MAG: RNA-binding domain-containing protein [Ruminococcus sp.]
MTYENEYTEFKTLVTNDLYKEVVAFANTDGGTIHIGVDDFGNKIGVSDIDDAYTRITNGIRDAIAPDVTMFCKYSLNENIIKIEVSEGSRKPYYLKSKGLKPSGVYIRQGSSSAPASEEQIRVMIKESDGDNFESMRSLDQNLTFDAAAKTFEKYSVKFSEEKYIALGIKDSSNSLYTNLGFLLSDQCQHTTKVAVFADENNTEFRDSKEFSGSLFTQLDDTFSYLMLCNKNVSEFKGLERIDRFDYPEEAIREALLNSIVHRDYSFSGSIIINVNDKEIEFISIGGLVQGLTADDIKSGISQPRNKNLAAVFHRLHLIESYGTGIRRIYNLYSKCTAQPRIEVTSNTFKIVLPNMNYQLPVYQNNNILTEQMKKVMNFAKENGEVTETDIQSLLNVKRTRAYEIAKSLCDKGLLRVYGRGINKKYLLP